MRLPYKRHKNDLNKNGGGARSLLSMFCFVLSYLVLSCLILSASVLCLDITIRRPVFFFYYYM